jgi:hypothetical protein
MKTRNKDVNDEKEIIATGVDVCVGDGNGGGVFVDEIKSAPSNNRFSGHGGSGVSYWVYGYPASNVLYPRIDRVEYDWVSSKCG